MSDYEILGVNESATPAEIKRAYHAAAKRLHPDVNDAPNAAAMFRMVTEAYKRISAGTPKLDDTQVSASHSASQSYSSSNTSSQGSPSQTANRTTSSNNSHYYESRFYGSYNEFRSSSRAKTHSKSYSKEEREKFDYQLKKALRQEERNRIFWATLIKFAIIAFFVYFLFVRKVIAGTIVPSIYNVSDCLGLSFLTYFIFSVFYWIFHNSDCAKGSFGIEEIGGIAIVSIIIVLLFCWKIAYPVEQKIFSILKIDLLDRSQRQLIDVLFWGFPLYLDIIRIIILSVLVHYTPPKFRSKN